MQFKEPTPEEEAEFRTYARENLPGSSDWSLFHPVCRQVWWELACLYDGFDQEDPFLVFSDENPYFMEGFTRTRTAIIEVEVPWRYLTDNGEETEETGWEIIENTLKNQIMDFNRYRDKNVPNARFVKWENSDG